VLVAFLRLSGKRTLTKLNVFDLVVTVALGSTLSTMLLNKSVALAEGSLAMFMLIGLQYVVTFTSVRVGFIRRAVRAEPSVLLRCGEFCRDTMRRQRVTESEVLAAIRGGGAASVASIEAVVLETDGSMSVLRGEDREATSLRDVPGSELTASAASSRA
jgi:uncharacterized membrane protein YcaP (DUF421 family)